MNKRIQELAMQADIWTDQNYHGSEFYDVRWEEKFAELIVKDAIGVVSKRYMGDQNREDMEVRCCVEDLKKHFGVEE
jgi:hypothetical protein